MIFRSKDDGRTTRDPDPYLDLSTGDRSATVVSEILLIVGKVVYSPRPEYALPPVNPILAEFRMGWEHDPAYGAVRWLESLEDVTWGVRSIRSATTEEIDHARHVLTLLANLLQ